MHRLAIVFTINDEPKINQSIQGRLSVTRTRAATKSTRKDHASFPGEDFANGIRAWSKDRFDGRATCGLQRTVVQIFSTLSNEGLLTATVRQTGKQTRALGLCGIKIALEAHLNRDAAAADRALRMLHYRLDCQCSTTVDVLENGQLANIRIRKPSGIFFYSDQRSLFSAETEWADILEHLDQQSP